MSGESPPRSLEVRRGSWCASLTSDVQGVAGGIGIELGRIHGLKRGWTDAEPAGHVGSHPVLEGVLAGGKLLEEEIGARIADLLVPSDSQVPLVFRSGGLGLETGGARITQVHVLGHVLASN